MIYLSPNRPRLEIRELAGAESGADPPSVLILLVCVTVGIVAARVFPLVPQKIVPRQHVVFLVELIMPLVFLEMLAVFTHIGLFRFLRVRIMTGFGLGYYLAPCEPAV